jgi:lysyl-tRNA synthetase class 2
MQANALEKWDEEATSPDDDFVLAMEYGMPCQSGFGMWIDRILALLTKQDNLRDTILFPLMKSKEEGK